ncbi:MAG: thiol-disulfide isomerase [Bryobacteraceae bacterium]
MHWTVHRNTFLALAVIAPGLLAADRPTFSKDVAPILQKRCQQCHRPGEVAPMPFLTYQQTRPWAKAIRSAVLSGKMPPWFADPHFGKFSNDLSLVQREIDTLVKWIDGGAPEGDPKDLPRPVAFEDGWNIGKPDLVVELPRPLPVPATGTLDIVYIVVPCNLKEDRWVQMAEIRPGNRALVHHVNAFVRGPDSPAMRKQAYGGPYIPPKLPVTAAQKAQPISDVLVDYVPGRISKSWHPGQAKFLAAGSDLILQIHYQTNGKAGTDRTKVGLVFARTPPRERVISAVAKNWDFEIPAGAADHEVHSGVELATDVTLVSLQPHMHYRGRSYEYKAIYPSGESEVLLKVPNWDFNWQMTYALAEPKVLPRGTRIECTAHYDNSANNPFNPDPAKVITYGEQTWDEMMSGWMEVAVEPGHDLKKIFVLKPPPAGEN